MGRPNYLHHDIMVSGIQHYIQWNGKYAFKDGEFAVYVRTLKLQKLSHGSQRRKAEPPTIEEELMW